jgi:hypothetical protein
VPEVRIQVLTAVSMMITVFWDVSPCSLTEVHRLFRMLAASVIALIMEASSASETPIDFCHTTRHNITEDSHLQVLKR